MGREVRLVPSGWQHPVDEKGYVPLSKLDMPTYLGGKAVSVQMYETESVGTPISPAMDSPEQLARWLAQNKVPAFGKQETSYEAWLMVCRGKTIIPNVMAAHSVVKSKTGFAKQKNTEVDAFDKIDHAKQLSFSKDLER